MTEPQLIEFPAIGDSGLGFISVAEKSTHVPFDIKRVYWTYYTPNNVQRGGHAHKNLEQLIFAVAGVIEFTIEDLNGNRKLFVLDQPHIGLYIPKLIWREIKFSHSAVLLCLASEEYDEEDYIRDYKTYKENF
jgi:dTDP-4-dehydrorhamnose 3,5-epimerase-like enzyme